MVDADLPATMQAVSLSLVQGSGRATVTPTKVLDVEADGEQVRLVVSRPLGTGPYDEHLGAHLAWTVARGRVTMPVTVEAARRSYGEVWLVVPSGPPERFQERRHFRAGMTVACHLTWGSHAKAEHRTALTVDLSEGGVLALVRGEPPAVGCAVEVVLRVDTQELRSAAVVVRHVDLPGGTGVALVLPEDSPHADRLRAAAFDAERASLSRGAR